MPGQVVTQHDALSMSKEIVCKDRRQQRLMEVLFRKSGVDTRRTVVPWQTAYQWNRDEGTRGFGPATGDRMALYERYAPELSARACRRALRMDPSDPVQAEYSNGEAVEDDWPVEGGSQLAPDDPQKQRGGVSGNDGTKCRPAAVTHLVTVSCTGFVAPGLDLHLIDELGLSPHVQRVHVGFMGCHGAINGLRTARGLVAADPDAVVLLCAVELCSLHYRMNWDEDAMVGNALFADGAAALLIDGKGRRDPSQGVSVIDCASVKLPDSADQMSWKIGNHGFDMTLTGRVPESIREHLSQWLSQWLGRHGLSISEINDWIVHPGGPRILDSTEVSLGLAAGRLDRSRGILRELGNMSSPTVLFVLERSFRSGAPGPRVMLAFGPGLVAEAALLS